MSKARLRELVAILKIVDGVPKFFDRPTKFIVEGGSDTSVRRLAIVKMEVRPTDACTRQTDDHVLQMLDLGLRLRLRLLDGANTHRSAMIR